MSTGVQEKLLSKAHKIKVNNYPGTTSKYILDKVNDLVQSKPNCLLVHLETNDITNNVKLLNFVKKVAKKVKNSSPNLKNLKNQKWQMQALFNEKSMEIIRNIFKKEFKKQETNRDFD